MMMNHINAPMTCHAKPSLEAAIMQIPSMLLLVRAMLVPDDVSELAAPVNRSSESCPPRIVNAVHYLNKDRMSFMCCFRVSSLLRALWLRFILTSANACFFFFSSMIFSSMLLAM